MTASSGPARQAAEDVQPSAEELTHSLAYAQLDGVQCAHQVEQQAVSVEEDSVVGSSDGACYIAGSLRGKSIT